MYRLYEITGFKGKALRKFQYISCIGYTRLPAKWANLNKKFQYISCIGYTSQ